MVFERVLKDLAAAALIACLALPAHASDEPPYNTPLGNAAIAVAPLSLQSDGKYHPNQVADPAFVQVTNPCGPPCSVSQSGAPWTFNPLASSTGGVSTFFSTTMTNSATAVDAAAGSLYGIIVDNPNATKIWLQLFDLATGSVTLGSTTPKLSIPIPLQGINQLVLPADARVLFATAITAAITTTNTGSTAVGTLPTVNILYK